MRIQLMRIGVSRNTKLLGFASFLVDISSEMIFPLLPFFMTTILHAPAFVIGLMESLGEMAVSISGFFSGLFSDRIGRRKKLVISGYSLSAIFKVFLVFLTSWPQVVLLRVLERIGKGIRDVPRDALIGISEEKSNLGHAFGFRKLMDNTGAILGPLIATILLAFLLGTGTEEEAYRTIFAIAIIPAVLAVMGLFFLRDKKTEKTPVKIVLKEVFRIKNFRQFLVAGSVFALGQFSVMFFLLRANDFLPLVLIPVVYLAYNVFYTLFSMPAGLLSDRFGARKTLIIGMILFLLSTTAIAFFSSALIAFISLAALGLFMAIAETAPQILLLRSISPNYFASAIGAYKGVVGMIALPANLIAGALYTFIVFSSPATFVFSIFTAILGIILMVFLVKE
jgi:MFS family permease